MVRFGVYVTTAMMLVALVMSAGAAEGAERPRLAVADFQTVGAVGIEQAGQAVAELLLTRFDPAKYQLVERSSLSALLAERKLVAADLVRDPSLLRSAGLKGVRYIVVGSVVKLGDLTVSARLVNAASGDIVQTAEVPAKDAAGLKAALGEVARVLQMTPAEKKAYLAGRTTGSPAAPSRVSAAQRAQWEQALSEARASQAKARAENDRARKLLAAGVASRHEAERAAMAVQLADYDVQAAHTQMKVLQGEPAARVDVEVAAIHCLRTGAMARDMAARCERIRELRDKGVATRAEVDRAESEQTEIRAIAARVREDLTNKARTLLGPIPAQPGAAHQADLTVLAGAAKALRDGAGDPAQWPAREQALLRAIADRQGAYVPPRPEKRPVYDFFRDEPTAAAVVFVSDRSGSMIESFDAVRQGMLRSLSRLQPTQKTHVILFSRGAPQESSARALVPATREAKVAIAKFLDGGMAMGRTDPIPAIERAFAVLQAEKGSGTKVIHLLTDGSFPDNQKVLATIRRMNPAKAVRIHTYLVEHKGTEITAIMKTIARDSGGAFLAVSLE